MNRACALWAGLFSVLPILACSQRIYAEEKAVTLAWFPDFAPDGKWLVTPHGSWKSNEGGEVRVWDVKTGKVRHVIPSPRGVRTVLWSPKGTFFASGNYRGDLRLYDPETAEVIVSLQAPNADTIEVLQVSSDEKTIYGASGSGKVHTWDLSSKTHTMMLMAHQGGIWGMRLSPSDRILATAGKDGYVRVWSTETHKLLNALKHPSETNGLAFTSDSATLATGCVDGKIRLFDVVSGKETVALSGHQGGISDLCFSSDDKLLVSSGMDTTVRLWDTAKKQQVASWPGHTGLVFGATFSPDDKLVASGAWDDTIRIWDVESGKQLRELTRHNK
jgi:WD40 repeat protein